MVGIDKTPNRRAPGGDFLRVFGVAEESGGTYINSVLPEENSWYRGNQVTVELHNLRQNGWYKRAQRLETTARKGRESKRKAEGFVYP